MSIFVAVATIGDNQFPFTIADIFEKADNPQDIFVGAAHMTTEEIYLDQYEKCKQYPNVKHAMFDPAENVGVGKGRGNAYSFYNEEDYVLQIDSHTKFENGWDTILIKTFEEAQKEVGNDRLVLTSYLPKYIHKDGQEREGVGPNKALFSFLTDKKRPKRDNVWSCDNISLLEMEFNPNFLQKGSNKKKFVPAIKICGGMIFGKSYFAKNTGLPRECLFWPEEIIQSINLLHYGFAMVFPNIPMPLRHLYAEDLEAGPSNRVSQILEYYGLSAKDDDEFYVNWINDPENKDRIESYAKYSNFHPVTGSIKPFTIPSSYTA
jgi:hypothetical protein